MSPAKCDGRPAGPCGRHVKPESGTLLIAGIGTTYSAPAIGRSAGYTEFPDPEQPATRRRLGRRAKPAEDPDPLAAAWPHAEGTRTR